ncbi:aspartate carbamoyltransferase [Proteinivorax hydrogeniformans]|uniref:Aspartate carbamoyltransferase n=1 Tax=Proteinivorax hydrogeniformans TaxID=1826727 RepID=A0AAU8HPV8_9FIRM
MKLNCKHLCHSLDLSLEELDYLFNLAKEMKKNPAKYSNSLAGHILGTLFFEPSTRTRLSFESAMLRLGGQVLGFSDSDQSSAKKGEGLWDTVRVMDGYCDIMVIRHPKEGSSLLASEYSQVPVINGGDGGHQHPTQTLTDLFTIVTEKGSLENKNFAFVGDLKHGRTVHSTLLALARYKGNKFTLISPSELKIPAYLREQLTKMGAEFEESTDLKSAISDADVLYSTRIQKERFFNEEDYLKLKDNYIINNCVLSHGKKDMLVLHPLPRVNEISIEVDSDPRAGFFRQAKLGVYIRMALIHTLIKGGHTNA